jgi:hypothetical protein
MRRQPNWDWYGTWIVDWLCCQDGWESFDIWRTAYLEANPDIEDEYEEFMDIQLLIDIYSEDMSLQQFPYTIHRFFGDCSIPWQCVKHLIDQVCQLPKLWLLEKELRRVQEQSSDHFRVRTWIEMFVNRLTRVPW